MNDLPTSLSAAAAPSLSRHAEDVRDLALVRLAGVGPEHHGGFSNHAPMAVDAMLELGHGGRVPALVDHLLARMGVGETSVAFTTMQARIRRDLEHNAWRAVLAAWVSELAPGTAAAAFHGILRTAHAARALTRRVTPVRLDELAAGLAYWQVHFAPLPVRPGDSRGLSVAEGLAALAPGPDALTSKAGMIDRVLAARAGAHAELPAALDWARPPDPLELARAGAWIFVHAEQARGNLFSLLHGFTGMAAVHLLAGLLPDGPRAHLLRHAWHALAALRIAFAGKLDVLTPADPPPTVADLRARAGTSKDDHVIKLTAAAVGLHAITSEPLFLHAAARYASVR